MEHLKIVTPDELEEIIKETIAKAFKDIKPEQSKHIDCVYTIREACKYLKVSRSTIQRWRKEGKLRSVKVDSKVLFRQEDLNEILKNNLR